MALPFSCVRPVSSLGALLIGILLLSQPTLAETLQVRSTLSPKTGETFAQLMKRAEATAVGLIEQNFARNSKLTEMAVTILGERNGQEAPLLLTSVSRSNWRKEPKLRPWTTYFNTFSVALLGYRKPPAPVPVVSAAPPSTPAVSDPSAVSNPSIDLSQPNGLPLQPGTVPDPSQPTQPSSIAQNAQPPTLPAPASGIPPRANLPTISTNPAIAPSKAGSQNDPAFRDD